MYAFVKLQRIFWPSVVVDSTDLNDSETLAVEKALKRGNQFVKVCRFINEEGFHLVTRENEFIPYSDDKKEELIKKGAVTLNKPSTMDSFRKFRSDVIHIECELGDLTEELCSIWFDKIIRYSEKEDSKPVVNAAIVKELFSRPEEKAYVLPKKSPSTFKTTPSKRKSSSSVSQVSVDISSKDFICRNCSTGFDRLDSMVMHSRFCKEKTKPYIPEKKKEVSSVASPSSAEKRQKQDDVDVDVDVATLSSGKRRKAGRKRKLEAIKSNILKDWVDDDEDEDSEDEDRPPKLKLFEGGGEKRPEANEVPPPLAKGKDSRDIFDMLKMKSSRQEESKVSEKPQEQPKHQEEEEPEEEDHDYDDYDAVTISTKSVRVQEAKASDLESDEEPVCKPDAVKEQESTTAAADESLESANLSKSQSELENSTSQTNQGELQEKEEEKKEVESDRESSPVSKKVSKESSPVKDSEESSATTAKVSETEVDSQSKEQPSTEISSKGSEPPEPVSKPIATIKPTQQTAEQEPVAGPSEPKLVEGGVAVVEGVPGEQQLAEQVVHLVPVENADGSITYMLLSLNGSDIKCDTVASSANRELSTAPGEMEAIFIDKQMPIDMGSVLSTLATSKDAENGSQVEGHAEGQPTSEDLNFVIIEK